MINYEAMNDPDTYVPNHIRDGIKNYIENGIPNGSFVTAILANDLREACGRADAWNSRALVTIVSWFWNFAPSPCWGSQEKVTAWLAKFKEAA